MSKKLKKYLLISFKLLLAMVLLMWVFSKAHWGNYVQTTPEYGSKTWEVKEYSQNSRNGESYYCHGGLFYSARTTFQGDDLVPVKGKENAQGIERYLRPGLKTIITQKLNLGVFSLAVGLTLLGLFLVGVRWWLLMRIQGLGVSLPEAIKLMFLGLFFNNIIPGSVGGDFVKAWYVGKQTHRTAVCLVTIFVDRIIGMSAMAIIAVAMIALVLVGGVAQAAQLKSGIIAAGVVLCVMSCGVLFVFSPRLRRLLNLRRFYEKLSIAHHISAAGGALEVFRRRPLAMLGIMAVAITVHCCVFGAIAILGLSLGLDIEAYRYFVYLPIIYIMAAVPVTPGGVGLIETLYVQFLGSPGSDASAILVLAMLARLIPLMLSLAGLPVAIAGPKLPKTDELEAELEKAEATEAGQ